MKRNVKRSLTLMMFLAAPFVSASSAFGVHILTPPGMAVTRIPEEGLAGKTHPGTYGTASWYKQEDPGINFRTANGELFNNARMTCALWHFPFKTRLKITNPADGKSVVCVVNDRGPAKHVGRKIDLSRAAFAKISQLRRGLVKVSVTPLHDPGAASPVATA